MPIYEYRCQSCGHQQEFLQKVSDPPISVCTQCGKPSLSKMVSAAGFQLKGSGWYATDFRNSGKSPSKPKEASGGGEAAKPETKSGDGEKKASGGCGGGGCACH